MTRLVMPDGTIFTASTLTELAEQWGAWVHGQGWVLLTPAQQQSVTHDCVELLRQALAAESPREEPTPRQRAASDGSPGAVSGPGCRARPRGTGQATPEQRPACGR